MPNSTMGGSFNGPGDLIKDCGWTTCRKNSLVHGISLKINQNSPTIAAFPEISPLQWRSLHNPWLLAKAENFSPAER